MKIDWTYKDSRTVDKLESILEELEENKSHIMLVDWQQELLLDYITNLQQKYDKALECLSSFNFEIPCENDEFFDEHCGWCEENCSVDEEQYKKCWNKFIEWKLGDRNG